jgi:hypothetical protein
VTGLAVGRKPSLLVIGAHRTVVVSPMAGDAVGRRAGKLPILMTLGAIRRLVFSSERKTPVVIEGRSRPAGSRRSVAAGAISGKSSLLVVGARGALVVGQVAAHTVGGDPRESAPHVALGAFCGSMLPPQRKGRMIELSPFPTGLTRMAGLALRREPRRDVIGILGSFEVLLMAGDTFRNRPPETTVAMTLHAIERSMRALESEPGDGLVIPSTGNERAPGLWSVAVTALGAKLELVRIILPPSPVARLTGARRSSQDPLDVAITALHGPVLPHQGKIRIVMGLNQILSSFLARGNAGSRRS